MRTIAKYFITAALGIMTLAGCANGENEPDVTGRSDSPSFTATISGLQSRAFDRQWESGDVIGISGANRSNVGYHTEDGLGSFKVKNTGEQIYFPDDNEAAFTAYYPWNDLAAGVTAISADTRQQAGQKTFDFLYAKVENVTGAQPDVELQFYHMMSKLTLTFKKGNDGTDLSKITSYEITGLKLNGTFDTATGDCAVTGDPEPLTITPDGVESEKALPSLILFPQTVDKVMLKIHDSENQEFSCELKFKENKLASGNNYQFNITVNKTGLVLTNFGIEDWTTVKNGGDDEEDPVAGSSD